MNLTVEERREARRRRILENSESRLAKILSRTNIEGDKPAPVEIVRSAPSSFVENDLISSNKLGNISDNSYLDNEEDNLDPTVLMFKEDQEKFESYSFEYFRKYFAVLAVLVYFIIAKGGIFPSNSIFVPFITLSVIKQLLVYKHVEPATSIFIQVLVLSGLNPGFIIKISKAIKIFYDFFLDFCIYFFTFVLLHFMFETFFSS